MNRRNKFAQDIARALGVRAVPGGLEEAEETHKDGKLIPPGLSALTRELKDVRPLSLIRPRGFVWITGDSGLVAWGEAARIDCGTGSDRFKTAASQLDRLFDHVETENPYEDIEGTGPIAFGSFTFDSETPGSSIVLPKVIVRWVGQDAWVTNVGEEPPEIAGESRNSADRTPNDISIRSDTEQWLNAARKALELIRAEQLEKVVLARKVDVRGQHDFDIPEIIRGLAERYPSCFTFAFEELVGASPELLVRLRGTAVESIPLAGSAPRGGGPEDDKLLADALLASEKNLLEHRLAVESVVTPLNELCHMVEADPRPEVLRLSGVQHLATHVTGQLHTPLSSLELAGVLHPTAAVCGTPREVAMQAIRDLEGQDRGRYSGVTGWVDDHGDGEWAIALRCAEIAGSDASVFAGSGIVRGSVEEEELAETNLKLEAILSAIS